MPEKDVTPPSRPPHPALKGLEAALEGILASEPHPKHLMPDGTVDPYRQAASVPRKHLVAAVFQSKLARNDDWSWLRAQLNDADAENSMPLIGGYYLKALIEALKEA